MNVALYQVADQYLRDLDKLIEMDLDDQCFNDTLESLSGELEVKATNVAMFVRNLEANAELIKQAEEQMANRRKAIEKRADRIRQYLLENMTRTGINKIECPFFKIAVRENPESVVIEPDADLPAEFMRQPEPPPPAPDKVAIKAALKAGVILPGVKLKRTQRIDIK